MKFNLFSRPIVLAGIFLGLVFLVVCYFSLASQRPIGNYLASLIENIIPQKINAGVPVLLKIPKIGVNASIDSMGITLTGTMEAPVGPKNTGWFKFGPHPGDNGTAVIAGHFGPWKNGGGSVFDNLNKLKKGDKIYVQDAKGVTATFVVREVLTYSQDKDASDVFYSSDGKAHLNLVTCDGIWNPVQKTYNNRLVVFTDKE